MNQTTGNGKRLDGTGAIITGATGGIGEATAKCSLQEGASVMLVGRSAEKLKQTRARLGEFESVAEFVAAANIRVNAIGPGPIDNRMIQSLESQFSPENQTAGHDLIVSHVPMKRYGTNEEVANLALFLASDEASYCTGGIHMIDGGFIAI